MAKQVTFTNEEVEELVNNESGIDYVYDFRGKLIRYSVSLETLKRLFEKIAGE